MALVTLADLRQRVMDRADMVVNSGPVTTAMLDVFINDAIGIVYDELVKSYGDEYFETDKSYTILANTSEYSLPDDFLKVSPGGVWWIDGSYNIPIHRYNPNEGMLENTRAGWSYTYGTKFSSVRYRVRAGKIRFIPMPTSSYSVTMKYIPRPVVLDDSSEKFDGYGGNELAVILHAAAACKLREESDASNELSLFEAEMKRIRLNSDRDANEPPTVQLTRPIVWEEFE